MFDDDFPNEGWVDFYNYEFQCVRKYLEKGLVQSEHNNYELKVIKATVEGSDGSGAFSEWINQWIKEDRLDDHMHVGDGISIDDLYGKFSNGNLLEVPEAGRSWNKKRFDQAVWDFVDSMTG